MEKNQNCVIWIHTALFYTKKTDHIYKDISEDVEARFETSNYELDKALPKRKIK